MPFPLTLVTGATGKTGNAVALALHRNGWPVRALVHREDARSASLRQKGIDTVVADLFDPDQLRRALAAVQRVYYVPVFHPFMIQASVAFSLAVRQSKVEAIVQMSQWLSSPSHPSLATRQIWLTDGLFAGIPNIAHVILNPGMFADNFLRVVDFATLLGVYPVLTADSRSAPVATEDIARVVAALLADPARHHGKRYRPTGPALLSGSEMAARIAQVIGRPVRPLPIPFWMFARTARLQGVDPFEVGGYRHYMEDHRRGAFALGAGVTNVVEELTGTPAEPFEDTVRRYVALPFAQPTFANRLRAFINFNRVPFQPGWNLNRLEEQQRFPKPPQPTLAIDDEQWRTGHGIPASPRRLDQVA